MKPKQSCSKLLVSALTKRSGRGAFKLF